MTHRIGIDIGGTFTDFALFDDRQREIVTHKALTTPRAPEQAVLEGVRALTRQAGVKTSDVSMVVHGTTLATNALVAHARVDEAVTTAAVMARATAHLATHHRDVEVIGTSPRGDEDRDAHIITFETRRPVVRVAQLHAVLLDRTPADDGTGLFELVGTCLLDELEVHADAFAELARTLRVDR